jgi:hypothetical protein
MPIRLVASPFPRGLGRQRLPLGHESHAQRLLAAKAKELGRAALEKLDILVTPDTLLRWYRELIAAKYDGSGKRGPGPGIMAEIEALILRMATDNPTWGYLRIVGALAALSHTVARTTIANVLERHGVELSEEKTLVTPVTQPMRFLGHHMRVHVHPTLRRVMSAALIPKARVPEPARSHQTEVQAVDISDEPMESPVHSERCTPGSERGAQTPPGAIQARR